jgi:hypothetical protein
MKIALILVLALATPVKDDTPGKDDTQAQDDMVYLALDRRQCGRTRGVIWMREDGKDFYVTGETRVNGTLPRLSGNYAFNGEELTRNGKPCKQSGLPPDEAKSDAAMLRIVSACRFSSSDRTIARSGRSAAFYSRTSQ